MNRNVILTSQRTTISALCLAGGRFCRKGRDTKVTVIDDEIGTHVTDYRTVSG